MDLTAGVAGIAVGVVVGVEDGGDWFVVGGEDRLGDCERVSAVEVERGHGIGEGFTFVVGEEVDDLAVREGFCRAGRADESGVEAVADDVG